MYTPAVPEDVRALRDASQLLGTGTPALPADLMRHLNKLFTAWARIGELDLDLLNRVGGSETRALAHYINSLNTEETP